MQQRLKLAVALSALSILIPTAAFAAGTDIALVGPKTAFFLDGDHEVTFNLSNDPGTLDQVTGVLYPKSYDEQYPTQKHPGAFAFYTYSRGGNFATVDQTISLAPGWNACMDLYANQGDQLSVDERPCFGAPVDDTNLVASKGWSRKTGMGNYLNTFSTAKAEGANLQLKNAYLTDLAVVATKCPGCGDIRITFNGTKVADISLKSATVKKKQIFKYAISEGQSLGTIKVRVQTEGRPVRIDGIGVVDRTPLV